MYKLTLTDQERQILVDALRATVNQLDGVMEQGIAGGGGYNDLREVADASNSLETILFKLDEKGEKE